jgi:hypothetical protein
MTALDHLRKLIYPRPLDSRDNCAYCHQDATSCAPDCPWIAARRFVEQLDEQDRLNALDPCDPMSPAHLESIAIEMLKAHCARRDLDGGDRCVL